MKLRRLLGCTLAIGFVPLLGACGVEPLPATGTLTEETFHSEIVDDDYILRIRTPPGDDEGTLQPYPLVLQLDPTFNGLEEYAITVGLISQYASDGDWPEAIVVGIDYDDPSLRERDYVPVEPPDPAYEGEGADRFFQTLRDEIIPYLEERFSIDTARRYLVGHSNGGVFAWYAAFRHDPELGPPLLAGVVAADNGYNEVLFTFERWHAERSDDLPMKIYATRAAFNGAIQKVGFDELRGRLGGHNYETLDLQSNVLETDHKGAIWPSFEHGLELLLGDTP